MNTIAIGQARENDCFSCSRKSKGGPNPLPQWRRRFAKCRKFSAPSSPNLVRAKSCAAIARACDAEIAEMILKLGDPELMLPARPPRQPSQNHPAVHWDMGVLL